MRLPCMRVMQPDTFLLVDWPSGIPRVSSPRRSSSQTKASKNGVRMIPRSGSHWPWEGPRPRVPSPYPKTTRRALPAKKPDQALLPPNPMRFSANVVRANGATPEVWFQDRHSRERQGRVHIEIPRTGRLNRSARPLSPESPSGRGTSATLNRTWFSTAPSRRSPSAPRPLVQARPCNSRGKSLEQN